MNKNTTRLTMIAGTTMALVIAGTAAVSAAGPRDRDDSRGKAGFGAKQGGQMMPGARGMGGMRGLDTDVERTERTVQTADGITTVRVEQGVIDAADEASLNFSLGSGEAVTVAIDEDTKVVAFEETERTDRRGKSRTRLTPAEVEASAIEAGAEIVVWSDSEEGADFVASRIVVKPADTEEAEEATEVDAEAAEADEAEELDAEAEEVEETEEAAATDA
jgi:hypothetical protein